MSQPLAAIRDAVAAVGQGNLETKLAVTSRDEFGVVAAALNEMVSGLKQRKIFKGTARALHVEPGGRAGSEHVRGRAE